MLYKKRHKPDMIEQIEIGSERVELADFIASKDSDIEEMGLVYTSTDGTVHWKVLKGTTVSTLIALLEILKFDILSDWTSEDSKNED